MAGRPLTLVAVHERSKLLSGFVAFADTVSVGASGGSLTLVTWMVTAIVSSTFVSALLLASFLSETLTVTL